MLPSFLLSLREGMEAALIIGIVLGALRKLNKPELALTVWWGTLSAGLLSVLVALFLTVLGASLEGAAEQIFEGFAMLLAAGVLTWMIFWMRARARHLKDEIEADVQRASQFGRSSLFILAFFAVMREGIELALFLTAAVFTTSITQTLLGALLGLATAALAGWALFVSTIRLDMRRFFGVTSILLILFAAGLVAHGVHEFNEVGWIPVGIEHVWDINPILDENAFLGQLLKALFGYNGNPSLSEVLAYLAYFGAVLFALRRESQPILLENASA